ncbi:MAG TPA: hypothetical protein VHA78_02845 [Candidatus Peribacteraceae bacterium]|nr:hypothetical protein [Candidatus Peribacteraceae bacterium]
MPFLYLILSFILNFTWENAQSTLYVWHIAGWHKELRLIEATATGDMLFMIIIYLALACVHRDWGWVNRREAYQHPATWIIAVMLGALIAISFELWAVYVNHRWLYSDAMPIIPIVNVGLSPVAQMITIPPLVIGCLWLITHQAHRTRSASSGDVPADQ